MPMFLLHRKDVKLDGRNPTILYGYGGFNVPMLPGFSRPRAVWLEMGGVYAVANLRGGGEYGKAWHDGGRLGKKQNVFDDFIAAAEWLQKNGWTSPDRLAMNGGSNGGLLVGAVMTQRPELVGRGAPAGARSWTCCASTSSPSAGPGRATTAPPRSSSASTRSSPTARSTGSRRGPPIRPRSSPPPTTTTAWSRPTPSSSSPQLQADQGGPRPVLARIETRAGHGAGKPTQKTIDEVADVYAFTLRNLGMELPAGIRSPEVRAPWPPPREVAPGVILVDTGYVRPGPPPPGS